LLAEHRGAAGHALVVTDGVFSMDGDIAPLDAISAACVAHGAWLMVDDAHGLGVLGERGAGTASLFPNARVDLQMGTLSKALGGYGGYVCATSPVIDLLKTRARTLIYTTGLPPANAAAALAALDVMAAEPALVAAPLENAQRFTRALDLPLAESCIVPIVLGEARRALEAARALEAEGFLVVAIRPPTVPAGTARLRVAFTAGHRSDEIDRLAERVGRLLNA
jgi:8-amino-7-oxononanoate synthase